MDFFASAAEKVRLASEQAQQAAESFAKDDGTLSAMVNGGNAALDSKDKGGTTLSDKSPEELKVYINKLVKLSKGNILELQIFIVYNILYYA